jgi:PAS domain S-box-containing protein
LVGHDPLSEAGRFQLLVENVVDYALYMLDPNGMVTSWNPGAERIKGYTADEIIGQHFSHFFTLEDRRAGKPAHILRMARNAGRHEDEGWRLRKDGTCFWALAVIDAIRDGSGQLIGFVKIIRDMTDRRAAEEALRESERRFRLLVDAVVDYALFMIDTAGRVTNWNSGAQRIKGYTADEIVGQHFSQFYTEEDRAARLPQRALETATREGRFEAEGWRVRKDGNRFWANVVIDAVRDDTGQLIGFAKITRDMTERRRAQAQLEHAREQLHQSQKMESLGQLTGGIAHDFNNILTAIISNIELLRGKTTDMSKQPQLEAALQAAQNGAALVRQMLVFARKQPLQVLPIDLNAAVQEIADLVRHSTPENIALRLELASELKPVKADPSQLQTCILNLAVNARDAMPSGGTLTIATGGQKRMERSPNLPAGDYVCLTVNDTGIGMTPEVLQHVFEPFFTTKEIGKGTGLGLAMVYGVTGQLGGEVTIESEPGRGTTVRIILPASDVAVSAAPQIDVTPVDMPASMQSVDVLYVEDDVLVGMATSAILENAGFQVHQAMNGEQALATLAHHPRIKLLVTDIGLPGMNGHDLVKRARRVAPDIGVLFVTGYDRTGIAAQVVASPRTDYIDKPYDPENLVRKARGLVASMAASA